MAILKANGNDMMSLMVIKIYNKKRFFSLGYCEFYTIKLHSIYIVLVKVSFFNEQFCWDFCYLFFLRFLSTVESIQCWGLFLCLLLWKENIFLEIGGITSFYSVLFRKIDFAYFLVTSLAHPILHTFGCDLLMSR